MKLENIITKIKDWITVPKDGAYVKGGADVAANLSALDTKTKELDWRAPLVKTSSEVTDFNDCTQFGIYQSNSASAHGWAETEYWRTVITIPTGNSNQNYAIQIGFGANSQVVYIRSRGGASGWSAWKQLH